MRFVTHLQFAEKGDRYPEGDLRNIPSTSGDILEVRYDFEKLRSAVSREDIAKGPSSLWRYAPMLPAEDPLNAVTLSEGWTPMLPAPTLARALGCEELYLKDEGRNPSGSFKDRGATVAVTRLRELGVKTVVLNSSGNAGAAWALYAARAGMKCVDLLPDDVLPASLQQCILAGAATVICDGPWQQSGRMVQGLAAERGWLNTSTLREPYRVEGKKTMGYEICEQLGWQLPDVVVYPTGGGVGAIGIFKAFEELRELGWIDGARRPRLVVTQYEGCAPIVKAFKEGRDRAETWEKLDVLPGGLKAATPPGDKIVLRLLRETGGTAVTVSTEEALEAVALATRLEGVFPCPEAATTLAGLRKALTSAAVGRKERIVVMSTGSGLKSIPTLPPAAGRKVRPDAGLPADLLADT